MKATYERQVVYRAAQKAVDHWQALFDARRQEWIESAAKREFKLDGFFSRKRALGIWRAAERFEVYSLMDDSGLPQGRGGGDWRESHMLSIAKYLLKRTDRLGATSVTLDDEDIMALRPVMKLAAGAAA